MDDKAAVAVLTNQDAVSAASAIANRIGSLIVNPAEANDEQAKVVAIFAGLQQGKIDQSLFPSNCNAYFSRQALDDFSKSLGPSGKPDSFAQTRTSLRGGMTFRALRVAFEKQKLTVTTYQMPDGTFEQFLVRPTQ